MGGEAAIHDQVGAGHIGTSIAGQKDNGSLDILRSGYSARWCGDDLPCMRGGFYPGDRNWRHHKRERCPSVSSGRSLGYTDRDGQFRQPQGSGNRLTGDLRFLAERKPHHCCGSSQVARLLAFLTLFKGRRTPLKLCTSLRKVDSLMVSPCEEEVVATQSHCNPDNLYRISFPHHHAQLW